jgi:GNAT superfamily N-acetyltransferase
MHFARHPGGTVAIRRLEAGEHARFVAFLEAGMRPEGGRTRVDEDFPVALGPGNLHGLYGLWEGDDLVAGLAVLVRNLATSVGTLPVAGVGSVVTRQDRRGEGLSGRLQAAVLAELTRQGVPLAVLWTDRPDLYARRGFRAAGWEHHAEIGDADLHGFRPPGATCRPYTTRDLAAVVSQYDRHPWRTVRPAADHRALYGMPGTRGLVLEDARGRLLAYAFAGKGEDFPGYVAEWGGAPGDVAAVLEEAVRRGWARRVLLPQGSEDLVTLLDARGAGRLAVASGMWAVLDASPLRRGLGAQDPGALPLPERENDPRSWLGDVDDDGEIRPGPVRVAIWGLDSV